MEYTREWNNNKGVVDHTGPPAPVPFVSPESEGSRGKPGIIDAIVYLQQRISGKGEIIAG